MLIAIAFTVFFLPQARAAEPAALPAFDFTRPQVAAEWKAVHDVASVEPTAEGLLIRIGGPDPYLVGPVADFPEGVPLRLHARIKSDQAASGQLYYFRSGATEKQSVRFGVKAGEWQDVSADVPALGRGYRLRFDPPGRGGTVLLASLTFEPFAPLPLPSEWPRPRFPQVTDASPAVRSGEVELLHDGGGLGSFELRIAGKPMAIGLSRSTVGYVRDGALRWADVPDKAEVKAADGRLEESATFTDPDGATWTVRRQYAAARDRAGAIEVRTTVEVGQDRDVAFLPMFVLLPGAGSFGTGKSQGLFPGLEYLENEPSSSELDVSGPASRRLLPDPVKITIPMAAIAADGRYVGLAWEPGTGAERDRFSPIFDSPDRTFRAGGHAIGVVFPGYDRDRRVEGSLMPAKPTTLRAHRPLVVSATILGGRGGTVVPAVQQYVKLRALPKVPPVTDAQGAEAYLALAAHGWLDSGIREGDRYRHAIPGNFRPQPAADAALWQDWLATQVKDKTLADRLREGAKGAIARVEPASYDFAGIGHVRYPVESLMYGHVAENADRAAAEGRGMLGRFEPDGTLRYKPQPNGPDYGRTHYAPDANGHTASVVVGVLERAAVTGDPELIREGLRVLRAMDKFKDSVPRGAQTWECPLHIPDILASAKLVRAYTLGYELTGDQAMLDSARYWAWTGVPFVYLVNPTDQPICAYASTSVFGATQWIAPVWMGQPVQWTALVYAEALYRLLPHDPDGPWRQLADGITASGVQQTFPRGGDWPQYQGLLPDSLLLRINHRVEPAINPATTLAPAVFLYRRPMVYDFRSFRSAGLLVHAPGAIEDVKEETTGVSFTVRAWPKGPYHVLVAGLKRQPSVRIDGKAIDLEEPHRFQQEKGRLVLRLEGQPKVQIQP